MKKKVLGGISLLVFLVAVLSGCGGKTATEDTTNAAPEQTYTIKIGHTTTETHSSHLSFVEFKRVVEEKSNGRIKVEIYPNGQLGNDRESVENTQIGNITMTAISSAIFAQFEPSYAIFDLPFLFPDRKIAYAMFDDPKVGGVLKANLENKGIKCLGFWEAGYRHLTNSEKEIKSIDDLAGMKIRTMSNKYHVSAWELYGASPTPIAFSELFTALQQKTVDGQENPYGLIVSQKFYEVQPYLTTTGHILTVVPFVINKDFYDSLPDDLKTAVDEAATVATAYNHEAAVKEEDESKKALLDKGINIYELSAEEKAKFKEKAIGVYDDMKKEVDSELIDNIVNFK